MAKSNAIKLKEVIQESADVAYLAFLKDDNGDNVTSLVNSRDGVDMLANMVISCSIGDSENSATNRDVLLLATMQVAFHRPDFLASLKSCISALEEDMKNA